MSKAIAKGTNEEKAIPTPSIQQLLSALAMGVKSVNSFPITSKKRGIKRLAVIQRGSAAADEMNSSSEEEDEKGDGDYDGLNEEDDDELAYYLAFPEFSDLVKSIKGDMSKLLVNMLDSVEAGTQSHLSSVGNGDIDGAMGRTSGVKSFGNFENPLSSLSSRSDFDQLFEEPILWEACADACDSLVERVEKVLSSANEVTTAEKKSLNTTSSVSKIQTMRSSLVDMEKPQIVYGFSHRINNAREEPYIPLIAPSLPQYGLKKLDTHPFGDFLPHDAILANAYYDNPFREEIETFRYQPWQILPSDISDKHGTGRTLFSNEFSEFIDKRTGKLSMKGCIWIDGEADLRCLAAKIQEANVKEIAIDLEAHSWRSFSGFTCLMQISVRPDALRTEMSGPSDKVCLLIEFCIQMKQNITQLVFVIVKKVFGLLRFHCGYTGVASSCRSHTCAHLC